jgi:SRSO17 transposase
LFRAAPSAGALYPTEVYVVCGPLAACPPGWPPGEPEPVAYWLASLPQTTPLARLVGLAKLRWRVEHDYRELKDALGLDHFEGHSFKGWHHHVTLVSVAHAFVTLERLDPKARASA